MALSERYANLSRAQLSYDYLHTNSTTHEFLFGAVVELVDNSRDAGARNMEIMAEKRPEFRGGYMLSFLDDGCGMDQNEAAAVITFGYSSKRLNPSMIGQYGNGLKSGAMRVGHDFILFTKKSGRLTCVFLSRTFHEEEKIEEVIIPMPSFDPSHRPLASSNRHQTEMDLILKYSPFHTENEFFAQFNRISGEKGTLVIIYNLKLLDTGQTEFDFDADPTDIRIADPEKQEQDLAPERISLRDYLAIVYSDPRMKIYIRGKKVRTRRIISCLCKPRFYKYSSQRFRARAEKDVENAKELAKRAEEKVRDCDSRLRDFENKHGKNPTDKELRADYRKLADAYSEAKSLAQYRKDIASEKAKQVNQPKTLNFFFGLNLERRSHDGVFVYNNGRLIKMYEKVGAQLEGGVNCSGVVGVVDIPYMVIEPTHNKQSFADAKEYRQLLKAMGEYMEQYWRDANLAGGNANGLLGFWQSFGYTSPTWTMAPEDTVAFRRKRMMEIGLTIQCDDCLKWRILPFQSSMVDQEFPDTWVCEQNPDKDCNKCTIAEKKISVAEGRFEAKPVNVEKQKEQLQKNIEKQQKQLEKLAKQTPIASAKELRSRAPPPKPVARRASSPAPAPRRARSARYSTPAGGKKNEPEPPPTKAGDKNRAQSARKTFGNRANFDSNPRLQSLKAKTAAAVASAKKKTPPTPAKPKTKRDLRQQQQQKAIRETRGRRFDEEDAESRSADEESEEKEEEEEEKTSDEEPAPAPKRRHPLTPGSSTRLRRTPSSEPEADADPDRELPPKRRKPGSETVVSANSGNAAVANGTVSPTAKQTLQVERVEADQTPATPTAVSSMAAGGSDPQAAEVAYWKERSEELAMRLRKCLHYFFPPDWPFDKTKVNELSIEELMKIDLPEFFRSYESSLKKLVQSHQKVAVDAQNVTAALRANVAKLLNSTKPNMKLDAANDPAGVDLALQSIVKALH